MTNERDVVVWLPAGSVARRKNVYAPGASPLKLTGEVHGANVPCPAGPSSRHWNVTPALLELNVNDALEPETVPDGPESIVVGGGVTSASYAPESQPVPCG